MAWGSDGWSRSGGVVTPPTNTFGLVQNFTNVNGDYYQVDGFTVSANTSKAWSTALIDPYTVRFEIRSGDVWSASGGGYTDGPGAERSEISIQDHQYTDGQLINWEGTITLLPGSTHTGSFFSLVQLHSQYNVAPIFVPCGLGIEQNTDRLQVSLQRPGGFSGSNNYYPYTGPSAIVRGVPFDIKIKCKMGISNNGSVFITLNGATIVDYVGSVGATQPTYYWKYGTYRGAAAETTMVDFSHVHMYNG